MFLICFSKRSVFFYDPHFSMLSGFLYTNIIDVAQIVVVSVIHLVPVGASGGVIDIGIGVEPANNSVVDSWSFTYVHVIIHGVDDISLMVVAV